MKDHLFFLDAHKIKSHTNTDVGDAEYACMHACGCM